MKGYVYIISNRSMPGIYKVGYTLKDPELRAKELESTGVPHPFVVDYEILVDDPYTLEQKVHKSLSKFNENKEWFNCDFATCVSEIRRCYEGKIYYERCPKDERQKEIEKLKRIEEEKRKIEVEKEQKRRQQEKESNEILIRKWANEEEYKTKRKYIDKLDAYISRKQNLIALNCMLCPSALLLISLFSGDRELAGISVMLILILIIVACFLNTCYKEKWKKEFFDINDNKIQADLSKINSELVRKLKDNNMSHGMDDKKIIQCPECGQNLRVSFAKLIRVHCPKCDTLFYWKNS